MKANKGEFNSTNSTGFQGSIRGKQGDVWFLPRPENTWTLRKYITDPNIKKQSGSLRTALKVRNT